MCRELSKGLDRTDTALSSTSRQLAGQTNYLDPRVGPTGEGRARARARVRAQGGAAGEGGAVGVVPVPAAAAAALSLH